jgi:predicted nucleic acid-binding protein
VLDRVYSSIIRIWCCKDSETVAAALELFRGRPSLGFSDCLMVQLARKAGHLPLGTFDRNLAKVEGTQKL